jgi:hypothetical protein
MQPREKEKYENALGSIFDFIFEESKKPPSKVKPAKVTGVDGTTEIVDALSDVLTSPLLFVNDEIRNVFNDALDADILSLKVGERVGADTIKLSLSGVKDVLSDPGSWVDKQFADLDQKRKMQKAAWAGEEAKGILGALWARERGLDFDTQMAMAGAGRQGNRSTGADTEYMMSRSDDLVSKHFGGLSGNESKSDFVRKYGRGRGERMYKAFGKWKEAKEKGKEPSINTEIYYLLESEELKEKADSARQSGDKEKAEQYMRASKYTESIPYQQKVKHQIQDQKEKLKESAKYVEQLKKSSLPDKDQKIKELRTSMKDIKSNLRYMRLDQAADILGRTQGAHLSIKELFIDGNLIPNIINGKFFDENRNQIRWLQPSKMETKKFNGKEFKIHVGKGEGGPLKSTYYSSMNAVYYMSPVTWARSLTDGEIFAYAGHIRREFLKKSEFVKGLAGFDIEEFMKGLEEGDDSYLTRIAGSLTEKQLEKLQNFAKWDKTLGNLAYVFSTPTRIKKFFEDKVKAYIEEKIMKELRKKIGDALLKVITDKVAKKLIQSWVVTGGIKVLIKGIVTSIAATIGLVGTPLASIIIGAVTWIASDIIYKLAKPVLKFTLEVGRVLLYFSIGLGIIFLSLVFAFFAIFARFTHVSPHEVVMCEAYTDPTPPEDESCGLPPPPFSPNPTCCMKNTLGIPPSLVNAIEEAGNAYDVPPALILAVIYGEGYLNPGSSFYDEAFVAEHIKSCAQIPGCNPDGPEIIFSIIKKWWDPDAVKVFDPDREPYPCNILDGLFSVAKALQKGRYGSEYFENPATGQPYTCFGIPLNTLTSNSVSCDDWSNSDVISAIRRWQFGYFYDHETLSCATKANSCLMGGGLAAQCPTGGDTCETISSPEPGGRSHTGCLWDIYQANKNGDCIPRVSYPRPGGTGPGGGTGWKGEPPEGTSPLPHYVPPTDTAKRDCIFSPGTIYPMRCTQGPFGSNSHQDLLAIDVAANISGTPFWVHAPRFCDKAKKNCVVRQVAHYAYINSEGQLVDCGGRVLVEVHGLGVPHLQIDILHVSYTVTQGQVLGSYEDIAYVTHSGAWANCSTGVHAHVELKRMAGEGSFRSVDPYPVITSEPFNCSIGSCP